MKILLVHAHENSDSFCSALNQLSKSKLEALGHEVMESNLYKMNFNPIGGKHDFLKLSNSPHYKYAMEQLHASKDNSFNEVLHGEMQKLIQADVINFNFPLWWFGMPAILKGWVDRVFAYGVAYGGDYGFHENGRFNGKKAFLSITTGSPESAYSTEGSNKRSLNKILRNINEGIFELVGYEVLDPFVAYAVSRISLEERQLILIQFDAYLQKQFK